MDKIQVKLKLFAKHVIKWRRDNKKEFWVLVLILLFGSFFRLYRIGGYMTFLGDEGRDAIIVRRLLVDGDLILIGPGTSIGNMYLGPLYYYLIAPALLMANFSPVGPSILIALVGIATIFLIWYMAREWFGKTAAIISSFLYAISPTVIIYSRSSWNPNVMPFFALLCIYSVWRIWQKSEYKWFLILGVSYAFVLQSHYLGLLMVPTFALFVLLRLYLDLHNKNFRRNIKYILGGICIFLFLMSPLVIFDARHGWNNLGAIEKFFLERQTTVSARPWNALPKLWPSLVKISTRLVAGRDAALGTWIAMLLLGSVAFFVGLVPKIKISKKERNAYALLTVWLGVALLGLGLYKQEIYDHYYGFFFAAPFLLLGGIANDLTSSYKLRGWWIVGTVLVIVAVFNFRENPLKDPPNRQLERSRIVAQKIVDESGGEPFNLAVIAERNYEDAYQYYLEKWNEQVIEIDPQNTSKTITGQLFVVCELPPEKCDPVHSPKAEVANFGWSKISDEWQVFGTTLYKLEHTQ